MLDVTTTQVAKLAYYLKIYMHANEREIHVPPHIVCAAKKELEKLSACISDDNLKQESIDELQSI